MIKKIIIAELTRMGAVEVIRKAKTKAAETEVVQKMKDKAKDVAEAIRPPKPTYSFHIADDGDGRSVTVGHHGWPMPASRVSLCGKRMNQFMFDSPQHAVDRIDDPDFKADGVCPDCWAAAIGFQDRDRYGRQR